MTAPLKTANPLFIMLPGHPMKESKTPPQLSDRLMTGHMIETLGSHSDRSGGSHFVFRMMTSPGLSDSR